ncbi:MAG: IS21-like element helper ATPase IstB [Nanoarchaeota archaeon]
MKDHKNELENTLKYLRLHRIRELYESLAQEAVSKNMTHIEYLAALMEQEAQGKYQRNVRIRMAAARFPVKKTLPSFDFLYNNSINKAQILKLADCTFVGRKENIILLGPSGVGKTHLATALGFEACQQGISTLFNTAADIINTLQASLADGTFMHKLKSLTKPKLLVIDEIGFLPFDQKGSDVFCQLISKRYEQGSMIITSNRAFRDWGKIFSDNTIASAVIDRLLHHAHVISIKGDSYRTKDNNSFQQ